MHSIITAAQNGQREALKFLVNDCGHDIGTRDRSGNGVIRNFEDAPNWRELKGHKAAHNWVKMKIAEQRR
jgi:hypothetical protein